MKKATIIIYIDNRPYRFQIEIDEQQNSTTYYVTSENKHDIKFIPENLEFDVNGELHQKIALTTIEQEQTARLIWEEILKNLKP